MSQTWNPARVSYLPRFEVDFNDGDLYDGIPTWREVPLVGSRCIVSDGYYRCEATVTAAFPAPHGPGTIVEFEADFSTWDVESRLRRARRWWRR